MSHPRLILASGSPRRQQLLREAGFEFRVHPSNVDESDVPPSLKPAELAQYLALRKSETVGEFFPDQIVLAADTVVAHDQHMLSKPLDAEDATRMLRILSGTVHNVITGVCVIHRTMGISLRECVVSDVQMRKLSDAEIGSYIATGKWEGKAGGYGIQDKDPFVTRTAGCLTNIVGLPMHTTSNLLLRAGVKPTS